MRSLDKTSPERNPTETAPETGWFLPACLVASIALPALLHQRTSDDLELKWLSFWIATFPLALWICLPKTPRHPISISRICGVLLLTGLPALSGLWSHHPPIALARAATLTPLAVLLFTGSFLSSHPLARSRTTMGLVVLGGLTGFWIGLDPTHALPLGNTNHAGLFCALCLPLILAPGRLLSRTGSAWIFAEFILRGFALVGLSWGLVAAGSKGAWVGAAAGIWVVSGIALWRHPRGRKIGIPALLGFMVLLLCAPPVHEFLSGQLDPNRPTARVRLLVWKGTLSMIADHPVLGVGAGHFERVFPSYRHAEEALLSRLGPFPYRSTRVEDPHNLPLLVLSEIGIPGCLLSLALLLGVLRGAYRGAPPEWAGCCVAGLSATLFLKLLDVPAAAALLVLALGTLLPRGRPSEKRSRSRVPGLSLLLLMLLSVPFLNRPGGPISNRPDSLEINARDAFAAGHFDTARRDLQRCLAIDPLRAASWNTLGLIEIRAQNPELARKAFEESVRINPTLASAHFNLALLAMNRNDWSHATQSLQILTDQTPEHTQGVLYLAYCHEREGRSEIALETLIRAARNDPDIVLRHYKKSPGSVLSRYRNHPRLRKLLPESP